MKRPEKKRGRPDANTVIAVAALFTSVIAVLVAWDESRLLRESQRAAFLPIVETRTTFSTATDDLRIAVSVRNSGHGLAYLEAAELRMGDREAEGFEGFVDALLGPELADGADFSWATLSGYYEPNEEKDVIIFEWPDTEANREMLETFLVERAPRSVEQFVLDICYCSVFDECWWRRERLGEQSRRAEPTSECPSRPDPINRLWQDYAQTRAPAPTPEP